MNVDNDDFVEYNVKLLIVGTTSGFKQFYSKAKNLDTISNRLKSLEEVKGLDLQQTRIYFAKSMINTMKLSFTQSEIDKYVKHIFKVTNGVSQRIVEYRLNLCYAIEDADGNMVYKEIHKDANYKYLHNTLDKNVEVINRKMNSNETALQRRNQVIYTLGRMKKIISRPQTLRKN